MIQLINKELKQSNIQGSIYSTKQTIKKVKDTKAYGVKFLKNWTCPNCEKINPLINNKGICNYCIKILSV